MLMLVVVVFQQVMKQIFPLLLLTFCQILFLLPFVRRNDHNTTEKAQIISGTVGIFRLHQWVKSFG